MLRIISMALFVARFSGGPASLSPGGGFDLFDQGFDVDFFTGGMNRGGGA